MSEIYTEMLKSLRELEAEVAPIRNVLHQITYAKISGDINKFAMYLAQAKNEYDSLVAENEQLRQDLDNANALVTALDTRAEKAEAENERLKKSLKWIRTQFETNYEIYELEGLDQIIYLYVQALTEKESDKG